MQPNYLDEISALKIPPHNLEAEQSSLGAVFQLRDAYDEISFLSEDDFYNRENRIVYLAIQGLANQNKPFDIVTVSEWLEDNKLLDEAGGMFYLGQLADNTPSASNAKSYAEIVKKRSLLRQLLHATTEINDLVFNPDGKKTEEILDIAEDKIYQLANKSTPANKKSTVDALKNSLDALDQRYRSQGLTGLSTGFSDIDDILNGLQKTDLIVVAGRPSMGKTAFSLQIAEHAALKDKKSVAVFSLEMSSESLIDRAFATQGKIPFNRIRSGKLEDEDWVSLTKVTSEIQESKLFIDDASAINVSYIRSRARKIQVKHGLDLIVIDYLQLMRSVEKEDRKDLEIGSITAALKAIAKDLNVPVILLSQLNRSLEQRTNKRPVMSDLRESGAIEQDADVIIFLYRDEVYDDQSPHKGIAEVIIGKQRNGQIGTKKLCFRGNFMRFDDYIGY